VLLKNIFVQRRFILFNVGIEDGPSYDIDRLLQSRILLFIVSGLITEGTAIRTAGRFVLRHIWKLERRELVPQGTMLNDRSNQGPMRV
jgi:hypothetical protein